MTTHDDTPATPTTDVINQHVSIRRYRDEPIPDAMLHEILNTARRSPTSSNMQAYSFVVVRNPETKKELAVLAGNQRHIETCDTFVACCADISRLETACEMHDTTLAKNLENMLVASVDAAIAGMTLEIAAESFGLGAVMIGGMRNQPQEAADLLGFPPGVFVVYGMCLGWPDESQRPSQKPRLPQEVMIHFEQYDTSDKREVLRDHDRDLAAHYTAQGRNLDKAAWTGVMAQKFSTPRRPELRATLEKMGFSFD